MAVDEEVIRTMLDENQRYFHCCYSGIIYADKDYHTALIDLQKETGRPQIPKELFDYDITSGISPQCIDKYKEEQGLNPITR